MCEQYAYYFPTEHGWEGAEVFKMGHTVDGEIWWGTWRWNGWHRDRWTREECQEWEDHCAAEEAAAEVRALEEGAVMDARWSGMTDPLGR